MSRLYLCGAGNPEGVRLALRLNAQHRRWDEIVLLDDDPTRIGTAQMGVPVIGGIDLLGAADSGSDQVVSLVARTTKRRRAAQERIVAYGLPFTSLVSDDVDLLGATVAHDLVAYQHATIGPEANVGTGCVVFMGATVGHECRIADGCVVAANAVINARVTLGEGVYVGSNAALLPEVSIGAHATIGAGAVVIGDVPAGATVVGGVGEVVAVHAGADTAAEPDAPFTAPSGLTDVLRRLWCEALGVERVDSAVNFFDSGGTSLAALRLAQRIQSETGRSVCVVDLFHHPTLKTLEQHLASDPVVEARVALQGAGERASLRRARLQRAGVNGGHGAGGRHL